MVAAQEVGGVDPRLVLLTVSIPVTRKIQSCNSQNILLTEARIIIGASVVKGECVLGLNDVACRGPCSCPAPTQCPGGPGSRPAKTRPISENVHAKNGSGRGPYPSGARSFQARLTWPPTRRACYPPWPPRRHSVPVPPTSSTATLPVLLHDNFVPAAILLSLDFTPHDGNLSLPSYRSAGWYRLRPPLTRRLSRLPAHTCPFARLSCNC